jgi:hypothetical protein
VLVVATCIASGCQPADAGREGSARRAPGDAAREWAIGIDRVRAELTRAEWTSTMGDATASLTAYAAGDTLRLVREVVTQGDRGRAASRYYFDGAQLRYFESDGELVEAAAAAGGGSVKRKERLVLAFDQAGATVEVARQVDGATAPVDSARIQGVVARAGEVARQWATSRAAPR